MRVYVFIDDLYVGASAQHEPPMQLGKCECCDKFLVRLKCQSDFVVSLEPTEIREIIENYHANDKLDQIMPDGFTMANGELK